MTKWLMLALVVAGLVIVYLLRSGAAADQRARTAEHLADSLTVVRQKYEAVARADSVALDSVRAASKAEDAILRAERVQSARKVTLAGLKADTARLAVRLLLDSLGVSTASLDALEKAHAQELAAKDEIIGQADSATAVVRTLLQATETALASERAAHQAGAAENAALRGQIQALKSGRRRDRLGTGVVLLGAVAVLVLR